MMVSNTFINLDAYRLPVRTADCIQMPAPTRGRSHDYTIAVSQEVAMLAVSHNVNVGMSGCYEEER